MPGRTTVKPSTNQNFKNSPRIGRYANQGLKRVLKVQLYNKQQQIIVKTFKITRVNKRSTYIHIHLNFLTSPCFNFMFFQLVYLNLNDYKEEHGRHI